MGDLDEGLIRESTEAAVREMNLCRQTARNRFSVTKDGMEDSPSIMLTRGMMHDSTSETREVHLLEHQGYRGMKVLFLERRDDWSISGIRMARRLQLATQAWLVRRKVDQHVIGWRESCSCCVLFHVSISDNTERNIGSYGRGAIKSSERGELCLQAKDQVPQTNNGNE
jgi:hypothetical protein